MKYAINGFSLGTSLPTALSLPRLSSRCRLA